MRLGPLGTALLPVDRPRVLLIDEIDKSDIDLPNNLLHVFEEGAYEIPELVRSAAEADDGAPIDIATDDEAGRATIAGGRVMCRAFPVVVLTSNGEREFPPAFLRRCVRLELRVPDAPTLERIVESQLGGVEATSALIDDFLERQRDGHVATDQLLHAVYLVSNVQLDSDARQQLIDALMAPLV